MTEIKDQERGDLHSASSFDRTVNCHGWRNLYLQIPKEDYKPSTSPEAIRGVRIHDAREKLNPLGLEDETEVLAYERGLVLEREVVRNWVGAVADEDEWKEGPREIRLWINNLFDFEPECSARLDIHYIKPGDILYCDWKTGAANYTGKAKDNWQCKVTATALRYEYDAKRVAVSLIKPEAFPNGYHDTYTFEPAELAEVEHQVRYHLAEARKPDAPRCAGDHCHFCPCKNQCPEGGSYLMLPIVVARAQAGMTKEELQGKVAMLGVEDLVYLWQRRGPIKDIQEAVHGRLKTIPEGILATFGIKLADGKDTSYVEGKNIKALAQALVAAGLPEADVWTCLSLDTAALNELALKVKGGTKKAAGEWAKAQVLPFKTPDKGEKILREI